MSEEWRERRSVGERMGGRKGLNEGGREGRNECEREVGRRWVRED